ncbi:uncharacterized protein LOC121403764 [Drosophila obscura]|uniref:uncharacterized protein LOC121403764 n=1 Tax=Drosophila obscura TaxID=7282 RepID=UPI001BB2A58F|nr:uncharacterized protein LOC121403764 [Drosophila obscura]
MDKDPLFAVIKCEMCINRVTNFVAGLCTRCENIWTSNGLEGIQHPISTHRVMAAIVASVRQPDAPMDPTFQAAMMNARLQKDQQVSLFHKIRFQFASSVLAADSSSKMAVPFETDDNYWDIPEIMDEDFLAFQHNVDLLDDIMRDTNCSWADFGLPE